jgi:hypothetical protein
LDVRTAEVYGRLVHDPAAVVERIRKGDGPTLSSVIEVFGALTCDEVDERISTLALFFAWLPRREQEHLATRCRAWALLVEAGHARGRP